MMREVLEAVGRADTIVPEEQRLFDWLDEIWAG
jgi:hypothetical protein